MSTSDAHLGRMGVSFLFSGHVIQWDDPVERQWIP